MWPKPVLFTSAVSKELRSAGDAVANTLRTLGYDVDREPDFNLEQGDIKEMLRRRIDAADGVIQIIGQCHGCELPQPDPDFGRVSYTQYEALYARQRGKKVWYLLLDDSFPTDAHDPEPEELRQFQAAYRQRILGDTHLYHPIKNVTELENRIHKLNPEFAQLRRRAKQITALVVTLLLVLMAGGAWLKYGQARDSAAITEIKDQNRRLLAAVRELSTTLAQASQAGDRESESARLARAYATLEDKLKLPRGTLERELPQFAEQMLQRSDTSLMDRASALFALKKFAQAEEAALAAKDKALAAAGQPLNDAIAAIGLAGNAALEQIQYARALDHYRAAAALTSQERDPVEWASVQYMVAYVLCYQGSYLKATEVIRPVITTRQRVLGAEHPDTLSSRNQLAILLDDQGKHTEAEAENRAVLNICRRALGEEDQTTLLSRLNLATALQAQGKFKEAETENRVALKICQRVLGPENPHTLTIRNNLAAVIDSQGNHAEAELEHRDVLAIRERVLGLEHPDTIQSRNNLANALDDQGKHAEAEKEFRDALSIRERVLGVDHPDIARTCYNLAVCLSTQGKKAEALSFAKRALPGYQKTLGEEHPRTKKAKKLVEDLEKAQ